MVLETVERKEKIVEKVLIFNKLIGWTLSILGGIIVILKLFPQNIEIKSLFIAIPLFFLLMFGKYPLIIPFEFPYFFNNRDSLKTLMLFWTLCIFLCAIGILKQKNIARITIIILSITRLAILVVSLYIQPTFPTMLTYARIAEMNLHQYLLSAVFPIAYIIYFVYPKVKEQFK